MTTVRRICLIVPLAAALLLAPVTNIAGPGATTPTSDETSSCCGPCCAVDSQPSCCAATHGDPSEHHPSVSTDACESCPPGECTCHCCCGTAGLVLALQLPPVSHTDAAAIGRCHLACDQLTARSDEPLLPPPIG